MASQYITHRSSGKGQPRVDWSDVSLGVFLAASPWLHDWLARTSAQP